MTTATLTDAEIDRFLAEKCGEDVEIRAHSFERTPSWHDLDWACYRCSTYTDDPEDWAADCEAIIARYTQSLDALFAPGGPVEKVETGGLYEVAIARWKGIATARIDNGETGEQRVIIHADTPARALAEACAKALGL